MNDKEFDEKFRKCMHKYLLELIGSDSDRVDLKSKDKVKCHGKE